MDKEGNQEVYFDQYCEKCKYWNKKDVEDPCNECLDTWVNLYSHKPIHFQPIKERNNDLSDMQRRYKGNKQSS